MRQDICHLKNGKKLLMAILICLGSMFMTVDAVAQAPITDRDKDGINDDIDKCPDTFGYARYQGCPIPDTDKDSVNDEEDKCMHDPGPASNFGCPVIPDVIYTDPVRPPPIFFTSGTNKLLPKSVIVLRAIIQILKDNPDYKLSIEGHTDSIGNYNSNLKLSEKRATSIAKLLIQAGIDEGRLTTKGFGSDKPLATNKTEKGRLRNRRVEYMFKLD